MNRNHDRWENLTIGQLGKVVTGKTPPSTHPELFGEVYPFITPTDMDFDCVRIKTERFLSEEGRETQKNLLLLKSTVCFTCIGATIGKICMTGRESFTNQQINSVIVNPQRHDPYFAYSLLRTLRNEIVGIAGGAATPIVNKTAFSNFPIIVPPLPAQRKIASILSAYDDLIENNTRRIAILEEMAQAIYRERFVNFRFPGHEKVKMVDSPLGKIPEGWEVVNVEDAVFINPRTTVPREGEKPFVSMGAVPHNTMLIDESEIEMRTGNSGSKFKNGDTLFARITPCLENGKTAFVQFLPSDRDVAFGSTEFIVLRSRTVCPEYVYLMARLDEFRGNAIKSMSGATGRQRVQEDCFKKYFIAQPESKVMELFALLMGPLFKHVFTLANKNENLCTTRDLLLPKLISGQIDVEDLDITVDESPVEDAT